MFVKGPQIKTVKNCVELSVAVYPERFPFLPERIWWRFPAEYAEFLSRDGSAFVPAFLLPCMFRGERLVIEAPVAERLMQSMKKVQSIYLEWFMHSQEIQIVAPILKNISPPGVAVGSFFSGGVDSFHTLFKNQSIYDKNDPEAITHLIFAAGFDIKLKRKNLFERVSSHVAQVAQNVELPLLTVSTNLKTFGDRNVYWEYYYGPFLAALGLLLGPLFRRVLIPSSFTREQLNTVGPNGTHPDLDALWSTEQTQFIHDGLETSRFDKIVEWLAPSPLVPEHLHVCWRNKNVDYNCGVCEKCLRTMIPLYLGTGKTEFPCFSRPLTPDNVRMIKPKETSIYFAHENLIGLENRHSEFDRQLKEALLYVAEQYKDKEPSSKISSTIGDPS